MTTIKKGIRVRGQRISQPQAPRINANIVNSLVRDAYDRADMDEAIRVGRTCCENLTDEQITLIVRESADLVGVTPGPIRFVMRPLPGDTPAEERETIECPDCRGDGTCTECESVIGVFACSEHGNAQRNAACQTCKGERKITIVRKAKPDATKTKRPRK